MKILGFLSMFLFTICFVPQIARLLKTRNADDISLGLCLMLSGGYIFGLIYVLQSDDAILHWGYGVGLVFSLITSALTVYYKWKKRFLKS